MLCILTILLTTSALPVHAENVTTIRSIYDVAEKVVDLDEYRDNMNAALDEFARTYEKYENSHYAKEKNRKIINELTIATTRAENNVSNWSLELDRCYQELVDCVNGDASLEEISECESHYILARKSLQEHLNHCATLRETLITLGTIDSEVNVITDTQLLDTYEIMTSMRAEYKEAVDYVDIGEVSNVKVPISTGVYRINSGFGARVNPFNSGAYQNHYGIDIDGSYGDYNLALFNGTVIVTNFSRTYGNYCIIDHGHGVRSLYAHAVRNLVSEGDSVMQYQPIQETGSTGASTGPHLHLALMIDGSFVDPSLLFEK